MGRTLISNLKEGMILKQDIILNDDFLLLPKGAILTSERINKLKDLPFFYVQIAEEEEIEIEEHHIKNEPFQKSYEALSHKTREIFDHLNIGEQIELSEINSDLNELLNIMSTENNVVDLLRSIKTDDEYTYRHSMAVSMLAAMLGKWMGFDKNLMHELAITGLFHDVGKMRVPKSILNKPGKLTDNEFQVMKKHTVYGYEVLKYQNWANNNILEGVLSHHERLDGMGYPRKAKQTNIGIFPRIIAVCDVFDAMTSKRVYKNKISPFEVAEKIYKDSFGVFDPKVSLVFLKKMAAFYIGNTVILNNGSKGKIVYINNKGIMEVVIEEIGSGNIIDLSKHKELKVLDVID